jgi:hypothetical protein
LEPHDRLPDGGCQHATSGYFWLDTASRLDATHQGAPAALDSFTATTVTPLGFVALDEPLAELPGRLGSL